MVYIGDISIVNRLINQLITWGAPPCRDVKMWMCLEIGYLDFWLVYHHLDKNLIFWGCVPLTHTCQWLSVCISLCQFVVSPLLITRCAEECPKGPHVGFPETNLLGIPFFPEILNIKISCTVVIMVLESLYLGLCAQGWHQLGYQVVVSGCFNLRDLSRLCFAVRRQWSRPISIDD